MIEIVCDSPLYIPDGQNYFTNDCVIFNNILEAVQFIRMHPSWNAYATLINFIDKDDYHHIFYCQQGIRDINIFCKILLDLEQIKVDVEKMNTGANNGTND